MASPGTTLSPAFSWRHPPALPIIVAHRGSSALAPENTMAAFLQAVRDGAHAVELDVRLTNDDIPIVIHDSRLDRTTSGHGLVRDHDFLSVRKLDAGGWFRRDFTGERVPALRDVLERLPGSIGVNIELKTTRRDRHGEFLASAVCAAVQRCRAENRVLVSSFRHDLVRRTKEMLPEVAAAFLFHPLRRSGLLPLRTMRSADAGMMVMSGASIRKRTVGLAHGRGYLIGEYTVNTSRRLRRSLRFGVDAIFTNDPGRILKLMGK